MAAKEAQVKALLTGSSPWTTLVTGGTFTWDDVGRLGLTPETAGSLGCYDTNGKLKLTAMLTFGVSNEANILTSERAFLRIWYYHDNNYALIRQARRMAKDLLNAKQVATTNEGYVLIRWVDDMQDFIADELGGAMAAASRYSLLFRRQ